MIENKSELLIKIINNSVLDKETDCWNWNLFCMPSYGSKYRLPYGKVHNKGKQYQTHRAVFEIINGEIPKNKIVMHTCDNPKCCNPEHLKLGTTLDNIKDKMSKGRHTPTPGESNGNSKLTEEQAKEIKYGKEYARVYAERFNVSLSCVRKIRCGYVWKHI